MSWDYRLRMTTIEKDLAEMAQQYWSEKTMEARMRIRAEMYARLFKVGIGVNYAVFLVNDVLTKNKPSEPREADGPSGEASQS